MLRRGCVEFLTFSIFLHVYRLPVHFAVSLSVPRISSHSTTKGVAPEVKREYTFFELGSAEYQPYGSLLFFIVLAAACSFHQ